MAEIVRNMLRMPKRIISSHRRKKLAQIAERTNTGCVVVSAVDAHRSLYPDRIIPPAQKLWSDMQAQVPGLTKDMIVHPEEYIQVSRDAFGRLDIEVTRVHMYRSLAERLNIRPETSPTPLCLVEPRDRLEGLTTPFTLLYYFKEEERDITHLHMITDDGSSRMRDEITDLYKEGWQVGAVLELSRR